MPDESALRVNVEVKITAGRRVRRVLCIDGGGMRGLIPAMALANWEQRTGKPICQQIDMVYGVSIGGILGLVIGAGLPAMDTVEFFSKDGPVIFKRRWQSLGGLLSPRYGDRPIEKVLQERLGDRMLCHAQTHVGTYALDIKSGDPFFFKSHDPDAFNQYMWEAGRATSAAQTYFPSYLMKDVELWDGGNVDNNPSLYAYADARLLWPDDDIRVLSLGCGMDKGKVIQGSLYKAGMIRAGLATVSLMFEADSAATDYTMRQLIGDNYERHQPVLPRLMGIDNASPQALSWLRESGQQSIRAAQPKIDWFIS